MKLKSGAYDSLITQAMEEALKTTDLVSTINKVDAAEAAERYSRLIATVVRLSIAGIPERDRVVEGADLVNMIIDLITKQWSKLQVDKDTIAAVPTPRVLSSLTSAGPLG